MANVFSGKGLKLTVVRPQPPDCARYNLGWLPGGDKSITTELEDTLESIEAARRLVKSGGMISVMLYRGHAEVWW